MTRHQIRNSCSTGLAAVLLAAMLVTAVGQAGAARPDDAGPQRGLAAIAHLGDRLPAVASANGLDAPGLRRLFLLDDTLAVDANDELLYIDERPPGEPEAADSAGAGSAEAPPVTDPAFFLHSHPGADHTIYLDFDGHNAEGTSWNNSTNPSITTGPYNTDGNANSWSASELNVIRQSWERVAEDFSPFDVNVTTEDPGTEALRRSGSGDTQWGMRVVITPDDWNSCGCGGFAYIGAFDDSADEPVYVFNSSLAGVAEASSHEVGHALNLAHDGLAGGTTYYQGHGSGEASWAPLMGASYSRLVTQWSRGEYTNANNNGSSANYGNGPDDLAVIASLTNGNGFGYRPDDHGDDVGAGTPLTGTSFSAAGVIEQTNDVDVFTFDAGAGAAVIDIDPAPNRPNLNVRAELRTAGGALVAAADPTSGLDAGFDLTLAGGSYQLVVAGTGAGDPLAGSPTGYTDYASLGAFTVTGTVQPTGPGDENPPAAPTGVGASAAEGSIAVSWTVGSEPDLASHTVYRSPASGSGFTAVATLGASASAYVDTAVSPATSYSYVVTATDTSTNESARSAEVSATTPAPDTTPPAIPTGTTATAVSAGIEVGWGAVGDGDLSTYRVYRRTAGSTHALLTSVSAPATGHLDTTAQNNTMYFYAVTAVDASGNESAMSAEVSAQRSDPDVIAGDVATTYGNVSGTYVATAAAGGATQTFTESHSGGRPSGRHDRLEHIWTLPVTGGNHVLHVDAVATDAGDGDGGTFEFSWSASPSGPWTKVIDVRPGESDHAADLGNVSGTIYIRVTDSNRAVGNNANDTISVDHVYLDGGVPPTAPPGPASNPSPGNGATDVSLTTQLSWDLGTEVQSQEVFFGTTSGSLASLGAVGMATSVDPGLLAPNTTYYWRVAGSNALGLDPGTEWSFTTGDAPAGPASMHIDSVTLSTVDAGRGRRYARATVLVVDDLGEAVSGVQVTGRFTGDINQTVDANTGSSGTAVITSTVGAKKPTFQFCVEGVQGGMLPLDTTASSEFLCSP